MLKNYFKTAWRNITRNKTFSLINIAGLSLGMACSILILLWVQDELSVDAFHANGARLYKVYEREYYKDHIDGNYDTPGLLAKELKRNMPEIEDAVMMQDDNSLSTLKAGDKIIKVSGTAAGDGLFTMFSYPLVQGTPKTALAGTTDIALSQKTATAFFGNAQNAMGKTILFDNRKSFTVSAVFKNLPANASRKFDYVINWDGWLQDNKWAADWHNSGPLTFVLLRKNANVAEVDKKLAHFRNTYTHDSTAAYHVEDGLQKFSDVYLHSHFENGRAAGGRIDYVRLFSIVAIFILLIACINFMNLTTARSVQRAKEVGVRKAVGALRTSLIKQFIGESLLLAAVAVAGALVLIILLLPLFNGITQKNISFPFSHATFWAKITGITLITGVVSGSYPALFLSSFKPVKVLKSGASLSNSAVWFRKGLVVFQFVLCVVLITGTIVISQQVNFIQSRNLGYDRQNLIYIPIEGELSAKYETYKQQALQLPGIENMSCISDDPTMLDQWTNGVQWDGQNPGVMVSFEQPAVGYDFLATMKLTMKDGHFFTAGAPADKDGYIINEAAAKAIGYAQPVGRTITKNGRKGVIIGVIKDFHFRSLHETIKPMIMEFAGNLDYGNILVRTQPGKTQQALANLEKLCRQINPSFPFTYAFSDEEYKKLYNNEQVTGSLARVFSVLAIVISCLGVLGLMIFTAGQRTKEIGIRKVLGASVLGVVRLLSADVLKLVVISIIIACPVGWWAMNSWLNGYAYKIDLSWWMFAAAGGSAIAVAAATISYQAIKAAIANPVKSLRTE
ncbi:MAG TPA: ABC transporter permease [Chitinophagaceae bacterium]|nr:ABC transporter permease [Chitinophagaceae bacterium]